MQLTIEELQGIVKLSTDAFQAGFSMAESMRKLETQLADVHNTLDKATEFVKKAIDETLQSAEQGS